VLILGAIMSVLDGRGTISPRPTPRRLDATGLALRIDNPPA
jgi:hypothetical protein